MNIIVAGSREFNDYEFLCKKLDFLFQNIKPTIICGLAKGADTLGKEYAEKHGLKVVTYPADWSRYGLNAGYRRNYTMRDNADALVAFWDGKSNGTKHMIKIMEDAGKPVRVIRYDYGIN